MGEVEYLLRVPDQKIRAVARALKREGIPFDAIGDLVSIDLELAEPPAPVHFGKEIADLINGINEFLQQRNLSPRVPRAYNRWSVARRHNFLRMATREFTWRGLRVDGTWWDEQANGWRDVVARYPSVFGSQEDKA